MSNPTPASPGHSGPAQAESISLVGCFPGDPFVLPDSPAPSETLEPLEQWLPGYVFTNDLAATVIPTVSPEAAPEAPAREKTRIEALTASSHRPVGGEAPAAPKRERLPVKMSSNAAGIPEIGAVIDKYRLDELLGTGGFAAVYRATHLLLRISVAIKLLLPKVVKAQPGLADLLCEEARFTAQVNHPNVVHVIDVTHNDQVTFIVMEYVDGPSLAQTLERQTRLHPRDVLQIGMHVCMGLKAALDQGLIHRDIKPANILLAKAGMAKIVDLGLARPSSVGNTAAGGALARQKSPLSENAVVGTPLYMPPEQAMTPDKVDFRSDMYSLGVTLYHAALGAPPFSGKTNIELIYRHQHSPVPSPEVKVPGFPPEFSGLLLRMMKKEPAERPASYDELMQSFSHVMAVVSAQDKGVEGADTAGLFSRFRRLFS